MVIVVFQVEMRAGKSPAYFDLAAELRKQLDGIDGFISVERFESIATPGKYLSLSFWRDAEAVRTWREHGGHRTAQNLGKREIFSDFRISVAEVLRDYTMSDRLNAASDQAGNPGTGAGDAGSSGQ